MIHRCDKLCYKSNTVYRKIMCCDKIKRHWEVGNSFRPLQFILGGINYRPPRHPFYPIFYGSQTQTNGSQIALAVVLVFAASLQYKNGVDK